MSRNQLPPDSAVEPSEDDRVARRKEMARALVRGGMSGVQVLSHEQAQEALTQRRREIIEYLRREDVESVSELARRLDRDKAQVSRDLAVLAEHAIIRYDTDGRAKSPSLAQEHVVIEPVV